jgi:hypothetical protein
LMLLGIKPEPQELTGYGAARSNFKNAIR